jgi:formamidopyrimidine-DNA glycosylase
MGVGVANVAALLTAVGLRVTTAGLFAADATYGVVAGRALLAGLMKRVTVALALSSGFVVRESGATTRTLCVFAMPELVDVEIVRRNLRRWLGEARIEHVAAKDAYVLRPATPAAFGHALVGRTVRAVDRKGKWLRIELEGGVLLFSHLGMTGDWEEHAQDAPKQPSERARLDVVRGGVRTSVRYLDARRFGRLRTAREDIGEWRALGPDPLGDGLNAPSLGARLAKSRRAVKDALMDQTVLAGIGNILATEALFIARVDPRSRSDALLARDVGAIVRGIRAAIRRELRVKPAAEVEQRVYGRAGKPCPRCATTIARVTLGGRTTAFCPRCQARRR